MREPFRDLPRGLRAFTIAVSIAYLAAAAFAITRSDAVIVAALAVLFAAASLVRPLPHPTGGQNFPNNSVKIVAALLWQPADVLLGVGIGTFFGLLLLRRNEVWRATNNGAGWGISAAIATLAAHRVMAPNEPHLAALAVAAVLAVLTNRVVNEGIFSIYHVLRSGHSFFPTWSQNIAEQWFGQVLPASMAVLFASAAGRLHEMWVALVLTGLSALALPVPRQELEYYHRFQQARDQIVEAMVRALESVSPGARAHGDRVAALAVATGRKLGMSERALRSVRLASRLHEVGLLAGMEDPQASPEEEAVVGSKILARFPDPLIAEIVRGYRHRWDDNETKGRRWRKRQPIGARILAAAKKFDAVRTETNSAEIAVERLRILGGNVLEPRVVDALIEAAADRDTTSSVRK